MKDISTAAGEIQILGYMDKPLQITDKISYGLAKNILQAIGDKLGIGEDSPSPDSICCGPYVSIMIPPAGPAEIIPRLPESSPDMVTQEDLVKATNKLIAAEPPETSQIVPDPAPADMTPDPELLAKALEAQANDLQLQDEDPKASTIDIQDSTEIPIIQDPTDQESQENKGLFKFNKERTESIQNAIGKSKGRMFFVETAIPHVKYAQVDENIVISYYSNKVYITREIALKLANYKDGKLKQNVIDYLGGAAANSGQIQGLRKFIEGIQAGDIQLLPPTPQRPPKPQPPTFSRHNRMMHIE